MKGKHLLLLLVLVGLAGAAGFHFYQDNSAAWSATGGGGAGTKVLDFPINDVARVTVKSATGELHLLKQGEEWTVQERANYPAAFGQVSDLLRKLWELKTVQEVKVGPSQFARLELTAPGKDGGAGTEVELQDKDGKKLAALLLGKKYVKKSPGGPEEGGEGLPAGRYVVPGGGKRVSLVADTLESVAAKAEPWLQRDFFKIENVKSVKLEGPTEPQHWTLSRENATAEWQFADAKPDEKLDPAKAAPVAAAFASASFADVLAPDAKPEDTGLDQPATLTFETFDHFTYVLKIGKPTGENEPVKMTVNADLPKQREPAKDEKPEDKTKLDAEFTATQKRLADKLAAEKKFESRPFLIAKTTLDQVVKDRAALLVEKKAEPAPAAANPVPPTPVEAFTPPVSVTTPPIAVPPLPPPAPKPPAEPAPAPPVPQPTPPAPPQ